MTGKLPICDDDLIEALSVSFEPRFPATAVTASKSIGVRYLLDRGILSKGYETSILCDGCERGCELPIEAQGEQSFFVCPTGYMEKPVLVSEDDISTYRFDFCSFRLDFARQNGLKSWTDDNITGGSLRSVARGRRLNKRIAAVYTLSLDVKEAPTSLPAIKDRIQCDRLIILVPLAGHIDKLVANALAAHGITLIALEDLFIRQTLDVDLTDANEPPPPNAFCRAMTHKGREFLERHQYGKLLKKRTDYDMFIDGFQKKAWKRTVKGKIVETKLTPGEMAVLLAYIGSGKVAKPARLDSSIKVFETARRKTDVKVSRYKWRAFITHQTPADKRMKEYQFSPPSELKFCLVVPLTAAH